MNIATKYVGATTILVNIIMLYVYKTSSERMVLSCFPTKQKKTPKKQKYIGPCGVKYLPDTWQKGLLLGSTVTRILTSQKQLSMLQALIPPTPSKKQKLHECIDYSRLPFHGFRT